mmetsp:Transcript_95863/g.299450  ORF Transcript_95863/g.299450 Transcript_95863/m.299450 type:complete len:96 (+) Transcript_95863:1-288(+)
MGEEEKKKPMSYPQGSAPAEIKPKEDQAVAAQETQIQEHKGPSDDEIRAYYKQQQEQSGGLAVCDPTFGSVFNEVPWDQGGSWHWWATWGTHGRG